MLKVKDDVDLKELENYGFKEWSFYYEFVLNDEYGESLIINKSDRSIEITTGMSGTLLNINILYDLIKADLIEKVEDK